MFGYARVSVASDADANNLENQRLVGDVALGHSLPDEGTCLALEKTLENLEMVKATFGEWSWQIGIRGAATAQLKERGCHRKATEFG